jgi:superfamily I DNA/RNA helicase
MTVHSAKGLEFPHVFILRAFARTTFPSGVRKVESSNFRSELMKEEQPKW